LSRVLVHLPFQFMPLTQIVHPNDSVEGRCVILVATEIT
jgi:hypothetical protein